MTGLTARQLRDLLQYAYDDDPVFLEVCGPHDADEPHRVFAISVAVEMSADDSSDSITNVTRRVVIR